MSEHVFFIAFFTLRLLFWDLVVRLCQTEEANHKQQKENQYENWMQKIRKCQPYWTKSATEQKNAMFRFEKGNMAQMVHGTSM